MLDVFWCYIIALNPCINMRTEAAAIMLDLALGGSGCDGATVTRSPRLLSDNGPSYIAGELAEFIEAQRMSHVRGTLWHPKPRAKSSAGTRP